LGADSSDVIEEVCGSGFDLGQNISRLFLLPVKSVELGAKVKFFMLP
jgi:hypothetical protein